MSLIKSMFQNKKTYIDQRLKSIVFIAMLSCVFDYSGSIITAFFGGLYLGEEGLIIAGVSSPVSELITFFCEVIPAAGIYLSLIADNEGDKKKSEKFVATSFTTMLIIGLAISLFTYFGRDLIVEFFSLEGVTAEMEEEYLEYFALDPLLAAMEYCVFELIFRADNRRQTFIMLVASFVISLPVSELLVKYLGVKGLALGNIAYDAISLIIGLVILVANWKKYKFKLGFDWACFKESFSMGFMYGQGNLYYIIYSVVMYWFIGKFFGETCMAVFALIDSATDICEAFTGVPYAMENHLGVYTGEKNKRGVEKLLSSALRIQFIVAIIATIATVIFAEPIAEFFEFEEEYAVECIFALRIYALSFVFYALLTFLNEYYASMEMYKASFILSASQYLLVGIAVAVPMGLIFGSWGIYIAKFIECPLAIFLTYLYIRKKSDSKTLLPIQIEDGDVVSEDFVCNPTGLDAMNAWALAEVDKRNIASDEKAGLVKNLQTIAETLATKRKKYCECTLSFENEPHIIVRHKDKKYTITAKMNDFAGEKMETL